MKSDKNHQGPEDRDIETPKQTRNKTVSKLSDFKDNYTVEKFLVDLEVYFEGEIDFNLEKIQEAIEAPGKLGQLIKKAKEKNTHPVTEFIKELFKELAS